MFDSYKATAVPKAMGWDLQYERVELSFNLTNEQSERINSATGQYVTKIDLAKSELQYILQPVSAVKFW